ncbi:MAG: [protein-PII] uridylyltransferase [Acidobacteriota bacterium]
MITRSEWEQNLERIKADFWANPRAGAPVKLITQRMEKVVQQHFAQACRTVDRSESGVALLATGGFGRTELQPHSDVDLIILFEKNLQATDEEWLKRLLHPLWDLGLHVGHQVLQLEGYSLNIHNLELATALLDIRLLAGDADLYDRFREKDLQRLLTRNRQTFLKSLVALTVERHKQFSDTIYQLEPDVKEAPGGTRDFQVATWIGRILYGVTDLKGLVAREIITPQEQKRLQEARGFLLMLRAFLHCLAGRNRNILSHESQEAIARHLQYQGPSPLEAVEALMKDYFLRAKVIHVFCESLIRRAFPPKRRVGRAIKSPAWTTTAIRRGALDFPSRSAVQADPVSMLKLFYRSAKYRLPVSQSALDEVRRHLVRVDEDLRRNPAVRDLFLKLLRQQRGVYDALFLMHDIGLLGQIFPEFDRIRCHVIQDFFHRYTVDEHSLLTIKNLEDLYHSKRPRERRFGEILRGVPRPDLLLFAMLFHDVGKADTGNHCEQSLRAVDRIADRMSLDPRDREKIRFLIQNHLEMSVAFQRRDITDELVIRKFAELVGTQENLRMLCLVTYADIKAVSPEALTPWKADLLWQLYVETDARLTRAFGEDRVAIHQQDDEFVNAIAEIVPDNPQTGAVRRFLEGLPRRYLCFTPREKIAEHFRWSEKLHCKDDLIIRLNRDRSGYELSLMAYDRPYLFAKLCGVLSYFGMNIVRGQAFANAHGIVLDVMHFEDRLQTFRLNKSEIDNFRETLQQVILDRQDLTELMKKRESSILFQPKAKGSVATFISFDDQPSERYTLMEIVCQDRYGLLYRIAKIIADSACSIEVALISTEGNRAIDVFYLTYSGRKLPSAVAQRLATLLKENLDGPGRPVPTNA